MPDVPAFCNRCGTAFPSGLSFNNSYNIKIRNVISGPCPKCGAMGTVPDGVFNFIDDTIEILSAPQTTIDDLHRLSEIIEQAKRFKYSAAYLSAQIEQEVPNLISLRSFLPKDATQLAAYLAVLVSIIALIVTSQSNGTNVSITINNVIEKTMEYPPAPIPWPSQDGTTRI
ncbi:hypothetical protein [Methylophilus sp.]|uniref:hypothetical protein n=1 Tax=Methylophilus sp. TaxID=29541 RepID=UPI00257E2909|nr:hypothetical protein [Methylophilus sp.]